MKQLFKDTVTVSVDDIVPDPNNPNKMTKDQAKSLVYSMEKFDDVMPIVVDSKTMMVADGHHRLAAYKTMGVKEIDVIKKDFKNAAERILFSQTMNKLRGQHDIPTDIDVVYALVHDNEDQLLEYMRLTAVEDEQQVFDYLARQYPREYGPQQEPLTQEDKDSLAAILDYGKTLNPETTISQTGDIWQLGRHRLLCGDCTNNKQLYNLFDTSAPLDIILTDPPYSSGGYQETGKKVGSIGRRHIAKPMRRDNLSTRGYLNLIYLALEAAHKADVVYLFTDWKMWINTFDVTERAGFTVRNMIVWDKIQMGMGLPWRNQHELVLFGKKSPAKMLDGKTGNVIQCKREFNDNHPTVKPVELLLCLLNNTEGQVVYDPFMGSGSTLIAAHQSKKTCYGVEIEPRYCDVIVKRWEQYTGLKAEKLEVAA